MSETRYVRRSIAVLMAVAEWDAEWSLNATMLIAENRGALVITPARYCS